MNNEFIMLLKDNKTVFRGGEHIRYYSLEEKPQQ